LPHADGRVSWNVVHEGALEYMTQIPDSPGPAAAGTLILGGASARSPTRGLDEVGAADDAVLNYAVAAHLAGALPLLFGPTHWGGSTSAPASASGNVPAAAAAATWSGIMAFTADMLPLVGRLEEQLTGRRVPRATGSGAGDGDGKPSPAEWIAAGYSGEGMVNAWLCGVAVGLMVAGRDAVDYSPVVGDGRLPGRVRDWLPREYLVSQRRLRQASVYELAVLLWGP
jgi:glycine/D-amino acid oxidase-like deaminating enzyme